MMRRVSLLLCVLVAIVALSVDRPRAAGPSVVFHAIGDLPGGAAMTVIRDATRAGGVLYAVGSAVRRFPGPCPCPNNTDTAIFWRWDGTTATLEALPDLVVNNTATNNVIAFDITDNAAYIAGQARSNATTNATQAVRITTNIPLLGVAVNLNLAASPFPVLAPTTFATAISDDGTVLYGTSAGRVLRFDTSTSTSAPIPTLLPTHTGTFLIPKGTSSDGSVAVGSSFGGTDPTRPFRYTHGSPGTVAPIPLLSGGTFANAQAVSPDGDLVLMTGNSASNINGEAYLYRASTGVIQQLGSPQEMWQPGGALCANGSCVAHPLGAGMTADGSVVVMNFRQPGSPGDSHAYFRNPYGWFHLTSALAANGFDVAANGWQNLLIMGMSSDGTLVYGAGEHNGVVEGFVADFGSAAIALEDFNPLPVAPTGANTSIVGAWTDDLNNPGFVFVFTDEGVYYHIEAMQSGYGFERGFYTFDGNSITFTTLVDTNGSIGASGANGSTIPFTVSFNQATMGTGPNADVAYRIVGSPGSFAGGWVSGDPTQRDSSFAGVAVAGVLFQASDNLFSPGDEAGKDAYTFTSSACPALLPAGLDCYELFIANDGVNYVGLSPDGLTGTALDDDGHTINTLKRIIDPARIPVIANTPLTAGTLQQNQPFSFDIDASLPVTFTATGLPNGLSIDSTTGVIGGAPTVGGQFVATIKAASSEGVADVESLVLTVAIPTPIGQDVTVQPVVSEGQGPITLTFDDVTSGGETTVEAVSLADLQTSGVPPPGNVDVGGVLFDVQTTATFTGLIELCFSYAGIDFGASQPRLFHYENNIWVDITTSVDTVAQIICGSTTSLSPFAILKSDIVRQGFYAPVNPVAGFLNTVKAGATVPLKFEVFVNGVEKTTTAGIEPPTTHVISCDVNAPEDPVDTTTVLSGQGLRYDTAAGQFVVNWKVPSAKGCYLVQVKTTQDQLALTARFKAQ